MDTKDAGRKGGQTTLARHGSKHYATIGAKRRKPDDQVTKSALHKRKWRANKLKAIGVLTMP